MAESLVIQDLLGYLTRGTGVLGVYVLTFWKADEQLTEHGRKYIYDALKNATGTADSSLLIMDRYFHRNQSTLKFLGYTLLFSSAAMAVLLIVYISLVPKFFDSLLSDEIARNYFLRQLFIDGLLKVFVVNYVGFSLYVSLAGRERPDRSALKAIALDIPIRVTVFCGLTATIYVFFAHMFGSFGGDLVAAAKTVGPTIAMAARFENLSGVYLYAVAISAFPLFIAALVELMDRSHAFSRFVRGVFFFLPFENKPIRSLAAVFGVFFAAFSMIVSCLAAII